MLEIIVVIISYLGLILQSSFFDYFSIGGVKPDILLTCLVFYSIFNGHKKGMAMGAGLGLLEDLFIGQFIGPMVINRLIIGLAVGFFAKNIYKENYWLPVAILIVTTFLSNFFLWTFYSIFSSPISVGYYLRISMLQSIYNLIFLPFFYVITYHITNKEK